MQLMLLRVFPCIKASEPCNRERVSILYYSVGIRVEKLLHIPLRRTYAMWNNLQSYFVHRYKLTSKITNWFFDKSKERRFLKDFRAFPREMILPAKVPCRERDSTCSGGKKETCPQKAHFRGGCYLSRLLPSFPHLHTERQKLIALLFTLKRHLLC